MAKAHPTQFNLWYTLDRPEEGWKYGTVRGKPTSASLFGGASPKWCSFFFRGSQELKNSSLTSEPELYTVRKTVLNDILGVYLVYCTRCLVLYANVIKYKYRLYCVPVVR